MKLKLWGRQTCDTGDEDPASNAIVQEQQQQIPKYNTNTANSQK